MPTIMDRYTVSGVVGSTPSVTKICLLHGNSKTEYSVRDEKAVTDNNVNGEYNFSISSRYDFSSDNYFGIRLLDENGAVVAERFPCDTEIIENY